MEREMQGNIPSDLKERNSRVIYDLFADGNCYSKADVTRLTGISAPTVMKIVDSLVEKEILCDIGEGESQVGRKPNLFVRNPKSFFAISVVFQEGKARIGLVDLDGEITGQKTGDLVLPVGEFLKGSVCRLIKQLISEQKINRKRVLGVCLGLPGIVDIENSTVEYADNIGLREKTDCTPMMRSLEKALNVPVFIENNINAAAIGEFKARKLDKTKDLIYISLGFGLGAGLVLNGKLRRGVNYFAGEIAYTSFNTAYKTREAPKGWLEEEICGDRINTAIGNKKESEKYLAEVSEKIALMIANFSVFLDFNLVVIGGLLTKHFGSELLQKIEDDLKKTSMFHIDCNKVLSEYPGLVGGAAIVFEKRLKDVL